MKVFTKRALTAAASVGIAAAALLSSAGPAGADPAPPPPCHGPITVTTPFGSRHAWYCDIYTSAPVMVEGKTGGLVTVGYLVKAGYANWFVCGEYTNLSGGNVFNYWYYTEADNGKWGWVNGAYYEGNLAYFPGMPACDSAIH